MLEQIFLDKIWEKKLRSELKKNYMKSLSAFLKAEIKKKKYIYPPGRKIFEAFNLTNFKDVKVVILGQDPYHRHGQAHGLSFSVKKGVKSPPSLQNIFQELYNDLGFKKPNHGNLEKWAKQGVLLLNSILTVESGKPGSHANKGWEEFTTKALIHLNSSLTSIVFILWGNKAKDNVRHIDVKKNLIISSPHPSPFSAKNGFFGSKPFSKTNNFLIKQGLSPIDWDLNE